MGGGSGPLPFLPAGPVRRGCRAPADDPSLPFSLSLSLDDLSLPPSLWTISLPPSLPLWTISPSLPLSLSQPPLPRKLTDVSAPAGGRRAGGGQVLGRSGGSEVDVRSGTFVPDAVQACGRLRVVSASVPACPSLRACLSVSLSLSLSLCLPVSLRACLSPPPVGVGPEPASVGGPSASVPGAAAAQGCVRGAAPGRPAFVFSRARARVFPERQVRECGVMAAVRQGRPLARPPARLPVSFSVSVPSGPTVCPFVCANACLPVCAGRPAGRPLSLSCLLRIERGGRVSMGEVFGEDLGVSSVVVCFSPAFSARHFTRRTAVGRGRRGRTDLRVRPMPHACLPRPRVRSCVRARGVYRGHRAR